MMTDAERRRLELSPAGLPEVLARLEASTSGSVPGDPAARLVAGHLYAPGPSILPAAAAMARRRPAVPGRPPA